MVSKARNPKRNKQDIFNGKTTTLKKPFRNRSNTAQCPQQGISRRVADKSIKLEKSGGKAVKINIMAGRQKLEI